MKETKMKIDWKGLGLVIALSPVLLGMYLAILAISVDWETIGR